MGREPGSLWIVKPLGRNNGTGIRLKANRKKFKYSNFYCISFKYWVNLVLRRKKIFFIKRGELKILIMLILISMQPDIGEFTTPSFIF